MLSVVSDITEFEKVKNDLSKNLLILKTVLDNIPAWVAVKDINNDYRYLLWNHKAEELSGIKASEIIGKYDSDFKLLKANLAEFRKNSKMAAENNGYLHVTDYDWRMPNGKEISLEGFIIHIDCDKSKYEIAMCHDITASKTIGLMEKSEFLIMDAMSIPVMLFDLHHKLVYANSAARKIACKPETEIFNTPCHDVFCRCENFPIDCSVEKTLNDMKSHSYSRNISGRDFNGVSVPIFVGGKPKYIMQYLYDISSCNIAIGELNKKLSEEKKSEEKTLGFISALTNNMREAVNSIVGNIEILSYKLPSNTENGESIEYIKLSCSNVMQLLENSRDFLAAKHDSNSIEKKAFVPSMFFGELRRFLMYGVKLSINAKKIPALALNTKYIRTVILNLIALIYENSPSETQIKAEIQLLKGVRLEIRLYAENAKIIYAGSDLSAHMQIAKIFAEKSGGKIEATANCFILAIEPVERF